MMSLALTVVSAGSAAEPKTAAGDGLLTALSYVDPTTQNIGFTDWSAIKVAHGVEALTSVIPEDFRIGVVLEISREEAFFAQFGSQRIAGHAETWGGIRPTSPGRRTSAEMAGQ
jgi:hypothetical protein